MGHVYVCEHGYGCGCEAVMLGKLSGTLLLVPDFVALISCCLAARSCYYHPLLCPCHWACRDLPFLPALGPVMLTAVLGNHMLAAATLIRHRLYVRIWTSCPPCPLPAPIQAVRPLLGQGLVPSVLPLCK